MNAARKQVLSYMSKGLDFVLPPRCVVSGELVMKQGELSPAIWRHLDFISDPFCKCCGAPFEYEMQGEDALATLHCISCFENKPPFTSARSALKYNDDSRNMILGFKHADKIHMVKAFTPWLRRAGQQMLGQADFIVPVPLHRLRLISRRYNQSAILANDLANNTGVESVPNALIRVRATPTQGDLNTKERAKNVSRAFALNPVVKVKIQGKTIVLIDDVYTTGATVKECTKTLLKAGAGKVHVLTLARVEYKR